MTVRSATIAMVSSMVVGLGACATTSSRANLASTADRLESSADLLARDAAVAPAPDDRSTARSDYAGSFARDTHKLAGDAREFRRTVEDRDSSSTAVQAAFDGVSRSYHAVRDEVEHAIRWPPSAIFAPLPLPTGT
jgi:hypothetical protein